MPPSKGKYYESHEMSEEELSRVLPRIEQYLAAKKHFGFFGRTYAVAFKQEGLISAEMQEHRARGVEYFKRLDKEGKL